ncbi:uncharacterized protein LOC6583325 isoform X1 [Drosophila mojavensis]|uniref:Dipeptidase n=1 Tax=Drosophila mojavensis TaxID=7230 RepID=A0A0Q9XMV6_DROMO|nr:uncharacterized protein LOC6583325 isoform X1 [Drosophila mojavensis]KRG06644.1 uncharacterized protein Dmoj_GI13799, isoform C [Drosophila mojavensis]
MSSGEWDLCALKALEEEEQKEFLALSQKNLFEAPLPTGGAENGSVSGASATANAKPALTYAQLHPHLLKLPTIDECQLIATKRQSPASVASSSTRLKFSRALSLSAHSLSPRAGGAGGGGGGGMGFGKKLKARLVGAKSSGSLSPSRHSYSYSVSPVYTPPPMRRCATLHHTQPVRKTFKTLQQLERQKRQSQAAQATQMTPQLQRIVGTNKTYWKYGANSTAASIIGQRARLQQQQHQQPSELESNTSDEPNAETAESDAPDSVTETGSCSVPLPPADSNELLRLSLMLTAASSAVTVTASAAAAAATGGQASRRYQALGIDEDAGNGETVAYEAFHRPSKSFERALLCGAGGSLTLTAQESHSPGPSPNRSRLMQSTSGKRMLKSTSLEGESALDYQQQQQQQHQQQQQQQQKHQHQQQQQIIGQPLAMMGLTTATNQPEEHQGGGVRYLKREGEWETSMGRKQAKYNQDLSVACYGHNATLGGATIEDELEHHIKHCSCSCNHMGYGNSMDYQTTGFGGLPDVTEHSNIRRTLSRQNSISNSDSGGEIASIQKSKVYGNAMTGGVVVGSDIAGIALDSKSPTSLAAEAAAAAGSSSKAKAKSARKTRNSSGAAHKSRRGSWMVALTLVSAICLLAIAATLAYQHFFMSPSRNSHAQRLRIVRRILREVPLVDGHNNFAWNVRKYAHSSLELVHLSHDLDHKSMWVRPAWAQTDMERLKQGLVGVQVWSAYVPCEAQGLDAVQLALEQIDIVRRLSDMYARDTVLATSSQDIVATHRRGLLASVIGIEGGHTIGSSLGVLRSFYSLGARYLSLTHRCDVSWAGSSASTLEQGLTPFGKAIVREMNRLGMMIDLSHSSDATARDVLQLTRAPVIFSHSAARQLCNSTRNVPDDILRLVAENGGLIMLSFDPEDVACGRQARLQDVIEHIKYVRAIAGIQHIGLGAGYDGIEMPPLGLEDVSKYPELLAALLEDHNWSEEDVAMLAGRNFLRILETVETVRDYWKRAAIQPIELSEPQPKTQCTYMSS